MKLKIFSFLVLVACGAHAALLTGAKGTPLVNADGNALADQAVFTSQLPGWGGWTKPTALALFRMSPADRFQYLRDHQELGGVNGELLQAAAPAPRPHHPAAAAAAERRRDDLRGPQSPPRGATAEGRGFPHGHLGARTDEEEAAMLEKVKRMSLENLNQQEIQRLTQRIEEMEKFRDRLQQEGKQSAAVGVTVRIWQEYLRLYNLQRDEGLIVYAQSQLAEAQEQQRAFLAHQPASRAVAEQREGEERRRSPLLPPPRGAEAALPQGYNREIVRKMTTARLEEERRRLSRNVDTIETLQRSGGMLPDNIVRTYRSDSSDLGFVNQELLHRRRR